MLWLSLSLASAFLLGAYEITRKRAVRESAILPVLLGANLGGLGLLGMSLALGRAFPEPAHAWGFELEELTRRAHLGILLKSCIVSTSWVMSYFAVKRLPISVAGPLRATSPVVTILGALLLFQESPALLQRCGIAVIFSGYFGFAWLGREEGIFFLQNRAVGLLVLGTCIGSLSGLYDKYLLQYAELAPTTLQFWFTAYNVMIQLFLCRLIWWPKRGVQSFRMSWSVPLVGVFLVLADQLYFRAMAHEGALVSVISLVRRSSVLVSFTVGGLLFREQLLKKKALFLGVIVLGLGLLFL